MSSARDNRQRAAARARLEREMAARLEAAAKRRRLVRSVAGASVAALVVIGAVIWIVVALSGGKTTPAAGPTGCAWNPAPTNPADPTSPAPTAAATTKAATPAPASTASTTATPVSPLPDVNPPRSGYRLMTITTDKGVIKIQMDLSKTPCTAASMTHLAETGFYTTGTNPATGSCHRLASDIFALQCGDPTGTGSGGPSYQFADENLQTNKLPAYHEGDVAMANSGTASSNGSQFFFVYQTSQLPGDYSLWGHVVEGLNIVQAVAAGGDDDAFDTQNGGPGGGHPLTHLNFLKVEVGPVYQTSLITPAPTPSPAAAPSTSASASASPKAS